MSERTTIVFPVRANSQTTEILLGKKTNKHGAGWWNGYGGKLENGESYEQSAIRETLEEVGLEISNLHLVARLLFYRDGEIQFTNQSFIARTIIGTPEERPREMITPTWFRLDELPLDNMWPADRIWVPPALRLNPGDNPIDLAIYYDSNGNLVDTAEITQETVNEFFEHAQK